MDATYVSEDFGNLCVRRPLENGVCYKEELALGSVTDQTILEWVFFYVIVSHSRNPVSCRTVLFVL